MRTESTPTDLYWDERANAERDKSKVNLADLTQRTVENDFILSHLSSTDHVLEIGCGNGYLTAQVRSQVKSVNSFDFSPQMIESAKRGVGETNNRFFVHSVLTDEGLPKRYNKIICVRVLINLVDTDEQRRAISNFSRWLAAGGKVILLEGFQDGFDGLNELRGRAGLPAITPAAINFYSRLEQLLPTIRKYFCIEAEWNSGMFDVLTRVVYPLLVGADRATGPSEFHERTLPLARAVVLDQLAPYARLRGFVLRKI